MRQQECNLSFSTCMCACVYICFSMCRVFCVAMVQTDRKYALGLMFFSSYSVCLPALSTKFRDSNKRFYGFAAGFLRVSVRSNAKPQIAVLLRLMCVCVCMAVCISDFIFHKPLFLLTHCLHSNGTEERVFCSFLC